MKIIFLCGSLELGKNGVGDYTRRLAGELIRNGHIVELIALNDYFVNSIVNEWQTDDEQNIKTLRLPATATLAERFSATQRKINSVEPNWISLQFVLYAFHSKGLPFQWINFFRKLKGNIKWHIMLHELWIGSKKQDDVKTKLIGVMQQLIVKNLLTNIYPNTITTSVPYFQELLKKLGKPASVLPIFSNLPFGSSQNSCIQSQLPLIIRNDRPQWLIAAMFGGVSSSLEVRTNFSMLVQKAEKENKKILLVHVGRSGNAADFFEYVRKKNLCKVLILGEQSSIDISSFFLHADLGVSTYSTEFLEKSGSIAAMLNNKLPVVLLKEADLNSNIIYPYAKHVKDIDSVTCFCTQSSDWSTIFSLQNSSIFYQKIFA